MKILNLYAGIGGNRKLWGDDHDITAVEINPDIAKIYSDFFPNDTMIVGDAHKYLLDHIQDDWDFIWSSPPCPSHSDIRRYGVVHRGQNKPIYPEMKLYEEVILLDNFIKKTAKYVVENVFPYYKPLIPAQNISRHLFWSNFFIRNYESKRKNIREIDGTNPPPVYDFDIRGYKIDYPKRQILRNLIEPGLGSHILKCSQDKELELNL